MKDSNVAWANHPAWELLTNAFLNDKTPLEYHKQPTTIFDKYKDCSAFQGMNDDATFQRHLRALRDQIKPKVDRVAIDQQAYDIFCKNNPKRQNNDAGQIQWEGSEAEYYLKKDMKANKHVGIQPQVFRETRPEYMMFSKKVFQKHIHQEKRLWKLENYLEAKAKGKKKRINKRKNQSNNKKAKLNDHHTQTNNTQTNTTNDESDEIDSSDESDSSIMSDSDSSS